MVYATTIELPPNVKENLPSYAQEIYKEVFNNAWEEYSSKSKRRGAIIREETAHKVAWAAVKKVYRKDIVGNWVKKS